MNTTGPSLPLDRFFRERNSIAMEGDIAAEERKQAAEGIVTAQEEPILPSSSSSDEIPVKPQSSTAAVAASAEIMRALQVVERDSVAIAESYASLFSSLRLALSEATSTSLENMECFNDVVGRLQESALDAATKGNRYLNSCLRLNEEMKSLESLFMQLRKILRKNVDSLDLAVNRLLRLP